MVVEGQPIQPQKSFGNKVLSTGYKVSGWGYRLKAIGTILMGIILIVVGIVMAIVTKMFNPLIFSGMGVIALLVGWFLWWRAKSLVKGRYY